MNVCVRITWPYDGRVMAQDKTGAGYYIKIVGKRVALPDHREGYRGITIDRILLLGIQAAKVQVAEC